MDSILIAVLLKLITPCFCRVTAGIKKKSDKINFITGVLTSVIIFYRQVIFTCITLKLEKVWPNFFKI